MLYRPYIHGLYGAINLPIHRYIYIPKNGPNPNAADAATATAASAAPSDTAPEKLSACALKDKLIALHESYEPRGLPSTYRQQAMEFAQKLSLNAGDKIYMRSTQDLAAVLLPDNSLVVIGPINLSRIHSTPAGVSGADAEASADANADATAVAGAAALVNAPAAAMQRRVVNLWLDMIGQIVVHDVLPTPPEVESYAEAEELIPPQLKRHAREVKLNAPHNQYRYELAILDAVAEGDLDKVNRAFTVPKLGKFGVLGPTPLRSMQNHVHNLNSLVSRTAIRAGILPEKAYALSDKFFMAAENCSTIEQCIELRTICARAFAAMIKEYREQHLQALPNLVRNANLLISRSLYEKCTVAELAQKLQVTPQHLERVFKQAMGVKLSSYICHEKIKEAQDLLRHTTESVSDIAKVLGFKAPSHFARCFREFTGLTPREFRNAEVNLNQA